MQQSSQPACESCLSGGAAGRCMSSGLSSAKSIYVAPQPGRMPLTAVTCSHGTPSGFASAWLKHFFTIRLQAFRPLRGLHFLPLRPGLARAAVKLQFMELLLLLLKLNAESSLPLRLTEYTRFKEEVYRAALRLCSSWVAHASMPLWSCKR